MKDLEKYKINNKLSIREGFRIMDAAKNKIAVVVDNNSEIVGVVTDGDLRRSIWDDVELSDSIMNIVNIKYTSLNKDYKDCEVGKIFRNASVNAIPIIDNNKLISIVFREDSKDIPVNKDLVNTPVVIMAGGKGTRLDPFTRVLPKPLIPVGELPITRVIMDNFGEYGVRDFYLSLNDKARMVKGYFHDHDLPYNINYVEEDEPLGTAGGLKYLEGELDKDFFVSNCDIIINSDYSSMMDFHLSRSYDLTVIGSMRHYVIPYGVCQIGESGELKGICEKPEHDLVINTGMYIINPSVLSFIPHDEYFDMNSLINELYVNNRRVGVYPISEKSWLDVGQWAEYNKTIDQLNT